MEKRGVSSIVATVLIILITIAAVMIIWVWILPVVSEDFDNSNMDLEVEMIIVTSDGYTVRDSNENVVGIQVRRGFDSANVDRARISFSGGGNSVSSAVPAPGPGQTKTYTFNLSGYDPEFVSVAPIFSDGESESEGSIDSKVRVPGGGDIDVDVIYEIGTDYTEEPSGEVVSFVVPGLIAWWDFDGDFVDSVGGSVGVGYGGVSASSGELVLDGADDYVEVLDGFASPPSDLTVCMWINLTEGWDGSAGYAFYTESFGAANASMGLGNRQITWPSTSDAAFLIYSSSVPGDSISIDSPTDAIGLNEWHHVCGVSAGGGLKVFLDGNINNSWPSGSPSVLPTLESILFGSMDGSGNFFNGSIDDVMIFDGALNDTEIDTIHTMQMK